MSNVVKTLASLRTSMTSEISESRLLECIEDSLARLRGMYRQHRREFSDTDIAFLQEAGRVRRALESFIEALAEIEDVYDGADCLSACGRLVSIREELDEYPVGPAKFT